MPTVLKSGSLNLLEPSGPVQTCTGIALPFILITINFETCNVFSIQILRERYVKLITINISKDTDFDVIQTDSYAS